MTPERWRKVAALYDSVLEMPEAERHQFLTRAESDDGEAVAEVRSLLAVNVSGEGILEDISRFSSEANPLWARPEWIGDFRILGILGEGGMGTVYRAEQANPKRTVAIKTLRGKATDAAEARFAREAAILARLQHPGIAQIYSAGTAGEQHFFAMELIEGVHCGRPRRHCHWLRR